MLSVAMLSVAMLNFIMPKCRYAECRIAECRGTILNNQSYCYLLDLVPMLSNFLHT